MNIKKIIAIIASTALTATLLASCGSSSSGKTAKKVDKAGLLAYAHGEYYGLGKKLGTFGYSVRKKKNNKNIRKGK